MSRICPGGLPAKSLISKINNFENRDALGLLHPHNCAGLAIAPRESPVAFLVVAKPAHRPINERCLHGGGTSLFYLPTPEGVGISKCPARLPGHGTKCTMPCAGFAPRPFGGRRTHRAPLGGPRTLPPFKPPFCFHQHKRTTLSVFPVCLVSYRESAIFPSHPPTSGKIEVWETTTLPSLPR